jgi:hypothetical protein
MSFDYDTLDAAPSSAIAQSQSTVWIDGAPWRIFELRVPCHKRQLYTRSALVAGSDLKTYDFGRLHVSAEGCADTSDHGYLEVEYDIELIDKQSPSSGSVAPTVSSLSMFDLSANDTPGADNPIPFDDEVANSYGVVNTAGVFTLPAGNWLILAQLSAGATTTLELWVDGATSTAPVQEIKTTVNTSCPLVGFVYSDGTTTCSVRPTTSASIYGASTRISFQMV